MDNSILHTFSETKDYDIKSNIAEINKIIKEVTLQLQTQIEFDSSISAETSEKLLEQLYQVTLDALEKIKKDDGNLKNDEQKKLYDALSSRQSVSSDELKGPLKTIAYLPELVQRMSILFKGILTWDSTYVNAYNALVKSCNDRIPFYMSIVTNLLRFVDNIIQPDFISISSDLLMADINCLICRTNETVDKNRAQLMLAAADLAYNSFETFDGSQVGNFSPLSKDLLDPTLVPYYDEGRGILAIDSGLRAWLGYKESCQEVIVAFSGTDVKNFQMVYADYLQLHAESVLYGHAVGLLNMICEKLPNYTIYVCGHSLGGGLAAFSSCACTSSTRKIYCYTFNTACLSFTSLNYLGIDSIMIQMHKTFHFCTVFDPVSQLGGMYGTVTILPKSSSNGHGLSCVKECFELYMNE